MNKLLSNFTVMYTKLHTYHYNVVGKEFYETHILLENEYNLFHTWIDSIAECQKMENVTPIGTLKEMLELSTIKEVSAKDIEVKEILEDLILDYTNILKDIAKLKVNSSALRTNMLEDIEAELIKKIWFFEATIK